MKIYLGCQSIKPEGFKSLDIDPGFSPDIVGDITHMPQVQSGSCSELVASHVLEHLEWPDHIHAFSEMSRILEKGGLLRIAVPDVRNLLRLLEFSDSEFPAMGIIFGVGAQGNPFASHRYGFTASMLMRILRLFGFSDFDWWGSTLPESANGWCVSAAVKTGVSLNVQARKTSDPLVSGDALFDQLRANVHRSPEEAFAELSKSARKINLPAIHDVELYQRIHFQLVEARQRIAYLEEEVSALKKGR